MRSNPILQLLLLCSLAIFSSTDSSAGGVLGDLVKGVGKATGIKPLEKAGTELDNAHRQIKQALPPYRAIEESGSEFVRKRFLDMCNIGYQTATNYVIARCSNWDGRLDGQNKIEQAVADLVDSGLFTKSEFGGVQIRWCPLQGAHGMAPDRGRVYIDTSVKGDDPSNIAALLAHEMTHIRQYRRMGTDQFKCEYTRKFLACNGCQDDKHSMEREAYDFEEKVFDALQPKGWRVCNRSSADAIWIAYAYRAVDNWVTEGWLRIDRGQCASIAKRVYDSTAYIHAKFSNGKELTGDEERCVHPDRQFRLKGDPDCNGPFETREFREVDVDEDDLTTTTISG